MSPQVAGSLMGNMMRLSLRLSSQDAQDAEGLRLAPGTRSGYRGVIRHNKSNNPRKPRIRYRVEFEHRGRRIKRGSFTTAIEAARVFAEEMKTRGL